MDDVRIDAINGVQFKAKGEMIHVNRWEPILGSMGWRWWGHIFRRYSFNRETLELTTTWEVEWRNAKTGVPLPEELAHTATRDEVIEWAKMQVVLGLFGSYMRAD